MERKILVTGLTVATVAMSLFVAIFASGALTSSQTIVSSGVIATTNIGAYSDSACTQSLTSVNWGTLSPGGSVARTIYVKNLGTAQVTISMTGANWNPPSADGPLTLTWNREGTVLSANQVATATLTLSVSSSISGITSFDVNIVITGTG